VKSCRETGDSIGIDARLSNISIIHQKFRNSWRWIPARTALVPAFAQKGWMGSWQDRNESPEVSAVVQALRSTLLAAALML
jgi:hypothetical protein